MAANTGAATMMPSGTLCTPMAAAITGPTEVYEEKATANPSGRLCSVMVMAIKSPSRIRRALDIFPVIWFSSAPPFPASAASAATRASSVSVLGSSGSTTTYTIAPHAVASVMPTNPFSSTFLT